MSSAAILTDQVASLQAGLDVGWTLVAGVLVFIMQAGFTLLEVGSVRPKNSVNIVVKNVIDMAIGAVGWFTLGYGLSFGESSYKTGSGGVVGSTLFFASHQDLTADDEFGYPSYAFWFFQFTFSATASTIVSGALAERCRLEGYVIFSFVMSTFIYSVVVHWAWGGGFLAREEIGYTDFAGSGVVHTTGGVAALVGAIFLGPRKNRFDDNMENEFAPGSILHIVLGVLILWFGWYGFNAGSTMALSAGSAEVAAHCCVTTTLSAACGGISSFLVLSLLAKKYDVVAFANGILAGLVGITAGCNGMDLALACVTGLISGLLYAGSSLLLCKLKIDDAVGAFPVHGANGIWGVIAIGLFDIDNGIFYGGEFDAILGPNLIGLICIISWSVLTSAAVFMTLKMLGLLRVDEDLEYKGLDTECKSQRATSEMLAVLETSTAGSRNDQEMIAEVKGVVKTDVDEGASTRNGTERGGFDV